MGDGLTEQQRKWLASVRTTLETRTGRSLEQWMAVAAGCPETAPRARQKWLKDVHGLGQNYALLVLSEVAAAAGAPLRDAAVMGAALWADPGADAVRLALQDAVDRLPGAITGQRKTFVSWSRNFAFAAARPVKGGVRLGLALVPGGRLGARGRESWSERLPAVVELAGVEAVDAEVRELLRGAWEAS